MLVEEKVSVAVTAGKTVTAIRNLPDGPSAGWQFLYAPGAGSNIDDPFGVFACRSLAAQGFACVRFQFPYMEERRRRPDTASVAEGTWRAVIEAFRTEGLRTVVGGRSFGGRMASHVVAAGVPVDALALFAYPLLSPSGPAKRRDAHLPRVSVPTLFCSGTRDTLCPLDDLRGVASEMPNAQVHMLEGADHSFQVLKSSGRKREEVWAEAIGAMTNWLAETGPTLSS